MSRTTAQIEELAVAGTRRLLARAREARSLDVESLAPRVRSTLDKYLLAGDTEEPSAQAINDFIDALHADDLCLVVACERGDEEAWNELVKRYGATVRSAARSASSNEEVAEDLAQSIWAELYGLRRARDGGGDGRPQGKIAYYSGRGSLGGWLRAVVGQLAVDQHRKQSRLVQTEEDADFDRLAQDSHRSAPEASRMTAAATLDPEQALAEGRAVRDVEKALARAIKELDAEDRLLVKLYYFDGLRLREAGAVLGVHEATASRRLTRVHAGIRQRVEAILTREHGWTREETARSLSEAASHLDTDLQLMLTTEQGERRDT